MEADREFILSGVLATIGLGCVVVGTLVLLTMHVVENQRPGLTERSSGRKSVGGIDFRLHHSAHVKQSEANATIEQPTQRAA